MDTLYTFFLGGSPFILVVAQKVYTFFGLVTGQVGDSRAGDYREPDLPKGELEAPKGEENRILQD